MMGNDIRLKILRIIKIGTFLDEMKEQCFDKYNCMTVAEAPGLTMLLLNGMPERMVTFP